MASLAESIIEILPELTVAFLGSGGIAVFLKYQEQRHKSQLDKENAEKSQYDRYFDLLTDSKDDLVSFLKEQGQIKDAEILRLNNTIQINEARFAALDAQIKSLNKERQDDEIRYEEQLIELEKENKALRAFVMETQRRRGHITGMTDILSKLERND